MELSGFAGLSKLFEATLEDRGTEGKTALLVHQGVAEDFFLRRSRQSPWMVSKLAFLVDIPAAICSFFHCSILF
jgi:hypothetical protein